MALYVPWLTDAARLTGHPVAEIAGWHTRGHGGMTAVEGVVAHHTAGPSEGEYPSLGVVRDGRPGLRGPLSQLGIGRSGTIYVIAAGVAYHAGVSQWAGYSSLNSRFLGIEAESVGTFDDWTDAQRDCYPRLCAALLFYMRRGADRLAGHKEVAPDRKIDPAHWDMDQMRESVAYMLEDPLRRIPAGGGRKEHMIDNRLVSGAGDMRLIVPTGDASAITARAWISAAVAGPEPGWVRVFAQDDAGGIEDWEWNIEPHDGWSQRPWREIPNGTTMLVVQYEMGRGGTITVETQAR